MASHEKLSAAANDRKARLAQLKSLKRKQAPTADEQDSRFLEIIDASTPTESSKALVRTEEEASVTTTYLSGRNFDSTTRDVKLGFENDPVADPTSTLEYRAKQLVLENKVEQEKEKKEDKGLDLFKLQPKKPNWDLKRDLAQKMKGLDVQTDNAIAKLVRERVEAQKAANKAVKSNEQANEEGEEVGMEGNELIEAMHIREQEEELQRKRDEDEDEEDEEEVS